MRNWLSVPVLAGLLLAGCAAGPHPVPDSVFTGILAPYKGCRVKFAQMDARIDGAGVRDGSYYRVPGYPYFRTDRLMASLGQTVDGMDPVSDWMHHMRDNDQEAREFEYADLGVAGVEHGTVRYDLLSCGQGLSTLETDDPRDLAALRKSAVPPDEYSEFARLAGSLSFAKSRMRTRLAEYQAAVKQEFARPLAQLDSPGPLILYQSKWTTDHALLDRGYGPQLPDELGFYGLVDSAWRALAEVNAPQLWIESAGAMDVPGAPVWSANGPAVDTNRPALSFQITFTRFGGQLLAQVNYLVWFPGRTGANPDTFGPPVDGFIWRVTLDQNLQPVVYDSVEQSGRDHRWYPAKPLQQRPAGDDSEPQLVLDTGQLSGNVVLRIQAGTHKIRRVLAVDQLPPGSAIKSYDLDRYEDVFMLAAPDGSNHNLYDPHGIMKGTANRETDDPVWLYGSGIRHPGALYSLGHHNIGYIERLHFDDPSLLETVFVPPPKAN